MEHPSLSSGLTTHRPAPIASPLESLLPILQKRNGSFLLLHSTFFLIASLANPTRADTNKPYPLFNPVLSRSWGDISCLFSFQNAVPHWWHWVKLMIYNFSMTFKGRDGASLAVEKKGRMASREDEQESGIIDRSG